jgi:hypothetical protein
MNDKTASTPTTAFACPAWCESPDESFDLEIATGQPVRFHERTLTRGDGFTVWISELERITPAGKLSEPVTIGLSTRGFDDCGSIAPAMVRDIAAALLSAADEVDTIEAQR